MEMGLGAFKLSQDGYESWYVTWEWEQTILFGESVWQTAGLYTGPIFLNGSLHGQEYGTGEAVPTVEDWQGPVSTARPLLDPFTDSQTGWIKAG